MMEIKYESSFLSDLRRLDNEIDICEYGFDSSIETLGKAQVVYVPDQKLLRICIGSGKEENRTVEFYYRVSGIKGESDLAFQVKLGTEDKFSTDRNIFEVNLDFPRSLCDGGSIILGKTFENLRQEDILLITTESDEVDVETVDHKFFLGWIRVDEETLKVKLPQGSLESIKDRGLKITGDYSELSTSYKEPVLAKIICSSLADNQSFLIGPGFNFGTSLFKETELQQNSQISKKSYYWYQASTGITIIGDSKVLESSEGQQIVGPRYIRSYSGINLYVQGMTVDGTTETEEVEKEKLTEITTSDFHVWTNPLDSAEVTEEEANCVYRVGDYLNPGETIYGNPDTNYLQYIKIPDKVISLRVYGLPGTTVEARFGRMSINGEYESLQVVLDEEGVGTIGLDSLESRNLNSIFAIETPNLINGVCFVTTEIVEEPIFVPTPGNVYLKSVLFGDHVPFIGTVNYIEYQIFDNRITEFSKGTVSLDSIPEAEIRLIENQSLRYTIDRLLKSVDVMSSIPGGEIPTAIFDIVIRNNYQVDLENQEILISELESETKIKIQVSNSSEIYWKIYSTPDFTESELPLFTLENVLGITKDVIIETNDPAIGIGKLEVDPETTSEGLTTRYFNVTKVGVVQEDEVMRITLRITALRVNTEVDDKGYPTWYPKYENDTPGLLALMYDSVLLTSCQFFIVQKPTPDLLEVWDNVTGVTYSRLDDPKKITLLNNEDARRFLVGTYKDTNVNWYYLRNPESEFEIKVSKESTELKNSGLLIHPDEEAEFIRNPEAAAIAYLSYDQNVLEEDKSLGTMTFVTVDPEETDWRVIVCADEVTVEVIKSHIDPKFEVTPAQINPSGIGVLQANIKTNFKFTVTVSSDSSIEILDDDGKSFVPGHRRDYDDFNETTGVNVFFVFKDWTSSIPVPDDAILITTTTSSTVFQVPLLKNDPERLIQSHYDTDSNLSEPRRLRFVNNEAISSTFGLKFKSNVTPEVEPSYNGGASISPITCSPVFEGYEYKLHQTEDFGVNSIDSSFSNQYYPISEFALLELSDEDGGYQELNPEYQYFGFYMKGVDNDIWIYNWTDDSTMRKALEEKSKSVSLYLGSRAGSSKVARVFTKYIPNTIFGFEDINNLNLSSGIISLNSTDTWHKLSIEDTYDGARYYKDYVVTALEDNEGRRRSFGNYIIEAQTSYNDSTLNVADLLVCQHRPNLVNEEGITSAYIRNNILPESQSSSQFIVSQLGSEEDKYVIEDELTEYPTQGGIENLEVIQGEMVEIISSEISDLENCTVEYPWELQTISVTVAPRYPIDITGRWVDISNFSAISAVCAYRKVGFGIETVYENLITGVTESYATSKSTNQRGYNRGLIMNRRGDPNMFVGVGPYRNQETSDTVIEYDGINPEGDVVDFISGVAELSTSGVIMLSELYEMTVTALDNEPTSVEFTEGITLNTGTPNLRITFPPRTPGQVGDKYYTLCLEDPNLNYDTKLLVRFKQSMLPYELIFEDEIAEVESGGAANLNFQTNLQEEFFSGLSFESDLGVVSHTIERIVEGYILRLHVQPNGSGQQREGYIKAIYSGEEIGNGSLKQGHFSLLLTPYYATYDLVEVPRTLVYPVIDLHNIKVPIQGPYDSEDGNRDRTLYNVETGKITAIPNEGPCTVELDLSSLEETLEDLFIGTKESDILELYALYDDNTTDSVIDSVKTREHRITFDITKKLNTLYVIVPASEVALQEVTLREIGINDYIPLIRFDDFVVTEQEGISWDGETLITPVGMVGTITYSAGDRIYKGDELHITTGTSSKLKYLIKYKESELTFNEEDLVATTNHVVVLMPTRTLETIQIISGSNTFTDISLVWDIPSITVGNFEAESGVIWENNTMTTEDETKGIFLDFTEHSDYQGLYEESKLRITTTNRVKFKLSVSYLETEDTSIMIDSDEVRWHWIDLIPLKKIREIKVYLVEPGTAELTGIDLCPTVYTPENIDEHLMTGFSFYASVTETPGMAIGEYEVPCKTESDNGNSVEFIPRKIFKADLLRQETTDEEVINLRKEGLVSGNWIISEVLWENESGKTDISEFFDSMGGRLVGDTYDEDYVYSGQIPYFEDTYITKTDYLDNEVTATTTFEVTIKNTKSDENVTFRFGYRIKKVAESINSENP
ncbi:MAG: hypothetical protein J6I84_04970 [Bacilli bacterium]|nr:hypothetical protein [Bacilli bacterium]